MKIPFTRHRSIALFLAAVSLPSCFAAAEETAPPKTQVLFMGADLIVQHDKKLYRVEDVSGSELKIHVGQQEVLVPTRNGPVSLQLNPGLKLAGASVKLDQLQSGPAYTYENDPMRKLEEASNNAMDTAVSQDIAQTQQTQALQNMTQAQNATLATRNKAATDAALAAARSDYDKSQRQTGTLNTSASGDFTSMGAGAHRAALAEDNYDAMEVSFKISSEVELDSPYMIILFRFHDPGAKPGTDGMVIHAQSLDAIDAKPHYVRVLRGGLPLGFKFVSCSVHVYNEGREVATSVSDKRVELTRNEAQQYLVMEHIGNHKGATTSAVGVFGTLPPGQRQILNPAQLTRKIYARIGKDGTLLGAYADESCTVPLHDTGLTTALGKVFFAPALEHGKPVEGVAHVRLVDF